MADDRQKLKNEKELKVMNWENALRKLKRLVKKGDTSENIERGLKEMEGKWNAFQEAQSLYQAQIEDEVELNKEREKFDIFAEKHEDNLEEAEKQITAGRDSALSMVNKTEIEEKRSDFQKQLSSIVVSKEGQHQFLAKLRETQVENWTETSQCKVIWGLTPEFYKNQFLGEKGMFQRASGLDDRTMASFEIVLGAGGTTDQMKRFSSQPEKSGNQIIGKFGMFAAFRRADGTNFIDVAYAVYDFKADLMGDKETQAQWLQQNAENGDAPTNKDTLMARLKVGDISALTENFIVSKALTAFAQSNVIKKVRWVEDETNVEKEDGEIIEMGNN